MGFWLWKTFQAVKAYTSDAATEVWDLPKKGIISNIMLEARATGGTTMYDTYMSDMITKVEVIGNGSTVIHSLTGLQIQASVAYDDGQYPPDKEYSEAGACWGYFDIRFGRYPGDPKYALDCSKWDSLELKITWAVAAGTTITTYGFKTETLQLAMYGLYSPDGTGLSPAGYLKKAQKKAYTTTAGGTEDLALPTDYPFRRLLLADTLHGHTAYNAFDYVTININNGARKPIDNMRGNDLMIFDLGMRGNPVWLHCKRYWCLTTSQKIHPPIGWIKGMNPIPIGSTVASTTNDLMQIDVALVAAGKCHIDIYGYCPGRSLAIDLEKWSSGKDGVEAMMDAWGFGQEADIRLQHTQGLADGTSTVVLEQYASHPG